MLQSETTTQKPGSTTSSKSNLPETVETQGVESESYSEDLRQEVSQQMTLTVGYAQRLQNLIHSEVEELENDYLADREKTKRLSQETIENIKTLGQEFRETVKLGVQLAGVKMRIEKGESA